MSEMTVTIDRATRETTITGRLSLDGERRVSVATGIGFLDHMLTTLAFHSGWDLELQCDGDLEVDEFLVEQALADRLGQDGDAFFGKAQGRYLLRRGRRAF